MSSSQSLSDTTTRSLSDTSTRRLSRRTALKLAFLSAPIAAGLAFPDWAEAAEIEIIDAVSNTVRPVGRDYVRYEDLYQTGDALQQVLNRVTGNRIITFPEGEFTFADFRNGYYDGVRLGNGGAKECRGIVGSGRNTVFRPVPNTASRDKGGKIAGTQITIDGKADAIMQNFAIAGSPQNGLCYGGLTVSNCPDSQVTKLYLRGASQGYANFPPGETFGINILRSDRTTVADCEIDGRDAAGNRVGSSPIGWNSCSDARLFRVFAHHGLCGMLTFWQTTNIYTEDYHCFSTSSGSGILTGSGINHEQSLGKIQHVRPQLFIHGTYSKAPGATASNGMHMSLANTITDMSDVQIIEPKWDSGPGTGGMFAVSIRDGYTIPPSPNLNQVKTAPKIVVDGVTLLVSNHPTSGYGDKDKSKYFSWIH